MAVGTEHQLHMSADEASPSQKITSATLTSPRCSIDHLPSELLAVVFELATHLSNSDLQALRLTCHKWSEIVSATPTIWTSIECNLSELNARNFIVNLPSILRRSKALPIDIRLRLLSGNKQQDFDDVFASLAVHSSRIRSLTIISEESTGFNAFEKFWEDAALNADFLSSLHVDDRSQDTNSSAGANKPLVDTPSETRPRAPNLTSLTLGGRALGVLSMHDSRFLHVISLTFVNSTVEGIIPIFLSALANLPSLAHLTFRDMIQVSNSVIPPCFLSQALLSLTFKEIDVLCITTILRTLRHAPRLLSFIDCVSLPSELRVAADTLEICNPPHFFDAAAFVQEWSGTKLILQSVHFKPLATTPVFFLPICLQEIELNDCCCYSIDALKDAVEQRLIDSGRSMIKRLTVREAGYEVEPAHIRWLRDRIPKVSWEE
ncbi:hypothetical protein CONPUDRAFT_162057 [Coniophora puteana RWD-64-598 SS2]|uniref:F-box domain-containing protein n=1 Tax=Coniophora puteana (strain RWD-64-598) TaxID=741705 RepID=A0A5M3MZZ3_CONPW|nr:uncharacterized protein CONPUDRAFT_162057 [Coniophora puteana RWD-64-598 SS2]EIW84702.1 hypothetical protein CONPUDRAFT_162057 [Coniophora puteana RWD-64-598 SS2]